MASSPVVTTEPEFRKAEAVFAAALGGRCVPSPPDEDGLAAAIIESGARHAVVGTTPYRHRLHSALRSGGVLARFGVGHDGIDKAKATAAGLLCTNTPGVLDQSVAEHALLLMAAAARHLVALAGAMKERSWAPCGGTELSGKRLVVIGCGPIGRTVARIAHLGFRMRVVGCRRSAGMADDIRADGVFERVVNDFPAAVRDADYVSLHIPATPDNRHFINRDRLSLLGAGTWLINTARGAAGPGCGPVRRAE
jgi:phosphoglycerate dehydrogenase-like enzyme